MQSNVMPQLLVFPNLIQELELLLFQLLTHMKSGKGAGTVPVPGSGLLRTNNQGITV